MVKKLMLFFLMLFSAINIFSVDVEVLDTNPSPIVASDYADITLRISYLDNFDESEKYSFVEYGIMKTNFITPYDKYTRVENFETGQTHSKTFKVYFSEEIREGEITLPIYVRTNLGEFTHEETVFIQDSLNAPNIQIGKIETNPNELLKDSLDNKIIITLQNLGEREAELLKAELLINNEFFEESYSYSLEDSISSIDNGEEKTLEFSFDILEDANINEINPTLSIRYRTKKTASDNYEVYEKEIPVKIKLTKTPNIVPIKTEQLDDFKIGSVDNRVKIYIKNIGDKKAEEVRVRVFPDISYPFSFQKLSQYVSFSLDIEEETSVIFETEVFDTGEVRDYPIKVLIESMVGDTRYTQEKEIVITTKENQKTITKDNLGYFIFFFVFLFGSYLGIKRYRKSKK